MLVVKSSHGNASGGGCCKAEVTTSVKRRIGRLEMEGRGEIKSLMVAATRKKYAGLTFENYTATDETPARHSERRLANNLEHCERMGKLEVDDGETNGIVLIVS